MVNTFIDPTIQEYAKKVGVQVGQLLAELLAEGMNITQTTASKPEVSEARDPQRLLKADEVAQLLNISQSQIYALMQHGEIPCVRIGRAVRVRPQDLEDYIESQVGKL